MRKRVLSMLLTMSVIASLIPVQPAAAKKKATSALSEKEMVIKVGEKKKLILKKAPKLSKKKIKKIKWSSTNKKVVYVKEKGKRKDRADVIGLKEGMATIKLKYNGKTYKCKVVVSNGSQETTTESPKTTEQPSTVKSTNQNNNDTNDNTKQDVHSHLYGEWQVKEKPTCVKDGLELRKCECGDIESRVIKAVGHVYDQGVVTVDPTYTSAGIKTYTCSVCGETKEESIPKLNETEHSWDAGKITIAATCTTAGVKTYTCTNCGETKTEEIAATGVHTFDDYGVYLAATYSYGGKEYPKCSGCGKLQIDANKMKKIPCNDSVSGIKRIEGYQGYNSITGGGSYKYKIFENGTIPSSIYFLLKKTKQECHIDVQSAAKDGRMFGINTEDVDVFKFSIYDGENTVEKTYSYAELSTLFTPENQLTVLQKIYGEESGARYNSDEQDLIYNKGGYAGSIDTALIKMPIGYEYVYELDGEMSNRISSGAIYINSMALAIICDDMGYVCNGGFNCNSSYGIE